MNLSKRFLDRGYLLASFCLTFLLHFAAAEACKRKAAKPSPPQKKTNSSSATKINPSPSFSEANGGKAQPAYTHTVNSLPKVVNQNATNSHTPLSKTPGANPTPQSQAAIMASLDTEIDKVKADRETFSQQLSEIPMTETQKRDEMIEAFRKKSSKNKKIFKKILKTIKGDQREQNKVKTQFIGIDQFVEERNALNKNEFIFSKEICEKRARATEKYTDYRVESKREQFKDRVKMLMEFVADNKKDFPDQTNKNAACVVCHSSAKESIGLLPCGDYFHINCLVERIILVWRQGLDFFPKCPGSCGRLIAHFYFFTEDTEYAKQTYLTIAGVKGIFHKKSDTTN